jgi:hypothetical protein
MQCGAWTRALCRAHARESRSQAKMTIKRFLIIQAISGGVINAILNGPPVLIILREGTTWHLWNSFPSIGLDTCGMTFGIASGTGWVYTKALRKQAADGKVSLPRGLPPRVKRAFEKWPAPALRRGLFLGGRALLLCALPTIGVLFASGVETWGPGLILTYKTLFGLVMGALFTSLAALGVMVDEEAGPEPVAVTVAA